MKQLYKIAICDDLAADRTYLSVLSQKWGKRTIILYRFQNLRQRKISFFIMRIKRF